MTSINILTEKDLAALTTLRSGEVKLGEKILTVPANVDAFTFMESCSAQFVLVGIPEDVGVQANYGRKGAATAYQSTLKSFVNLQHNKFCKGSTILILGSIKVEHFMQEASLLNVSNKENRKELYEIVGKIDKEVSHVVHKIISAKKIPIIIGGGHNNAYGNIKGLALAKGKPVNAINFDAHTDFRMLEGRHSGNGFSYAYEDGFLKNYLVFGLHESYVSKSVFLQLKSLSESVKYVTYEEIAVRNEKDYTQSLTNAYQFIKTEAFGVEVDLDAITGVYASAMTLSGFSAEQARQFIHFFGRSKNAAYLHICEGAPALDETNNNHLTGKLIATLITDFIKSKVFSNK